MHVRPRSNLLQGTPQKYPRMKQLFVYQRSCAHKVTWIQTRTPWKLFPTDCEGTFLSREMYFCKKSNTLKSCIGSISFITFVFLQNYIFTPSTKDYILVSKLHRTVLHKELFKATANTLSNTLDYFNFIQIQYIKA